MNSLDEKENPFLTPRQAAERLMVSPVTLRHWALAGMLEFATTPGGHRRYKLETVEHFANEHGMNRVASSGTMRRILVVDDDVLLTGYISELFNKHPESIAYEVAHDGFEAGRKLLEFRPHTVLLDLMMPCINGYEVCRNIKLHSSTRETRVVVMTGYYTHENVHMAIGVGAETCLAKPLDKGKLFQALDINVHQKKELISD